MEMSKSSSEIVPETRTTASSSKALKVEEVMSGNGPIRKNTVKGKKVSAVAGAIGLLVVLTACSSPAEKVQEEKVDVIEANDDLREAKQELEADVKQFRLDAENKISATENEIAVLNVKIQNSKSKRRAEYEKQIAVLEQRNKDLKQRMYDYRAETNEGWENFKSEFNSDMNDLGTSLKDFTVDDNN